MPTVPYSPGPRIPLQPLNVPRFSPNAPTEAFGGGIASERGTLGNLQPVIQGAEQIGDEQRRMAYQEKNRADQIAITDRAGQLASYRTDALYKNNNGGWLGLKGQNAVGVGDKAQTEFWQVSNVIESSLANDDQKAAFRKIAQGEWDQMHTQLAEHEARQGIVYDNDATQGALDAKRDQAVKAYDDPTIVEPAIHARAALIEGHGARNGLPKEFTDDQVAKATSDLRFEVLQQFVDNGRDLEAKSYLQQHQGDWVGKQLTQAETLVKHSSVEGEAIRHADIITGIKPAPDGSPVHLATNENDALLEAAKIDDPPVREKTEQRISLFFGRQASARRQGQEQNFATAGQMVEKTGTYDSVPMSLRLKMSTEENAALQRRAKQIQTGDETGDNERYMELQNEAYFNPDVFSQENLLSEQGLSAKQKTHLMTLQRTVGGREDRQAEADIQHRITRSDADARYYQRKAEAATDEEEKSRFVEQQRQAEDEALGARQELTARRSRATTVQPPDAGAAVIRGGTGAASSGAATIRGGGALSASPAAAPSTTAPVALTPVETRPATESMATDVLRKGPRYHDYLTRIMNVDPTALDAIIRRKQAEAAAEEAKAAASAAPKKKPSVSIQRDSAGRATSLVPQD